MQRVLDLLKDEGPIPEEGEPAWILGRQFLQEYGAWSSEFLDQVEQLIWLMYRTQFATPIPRHPNGPSPLLHNVNALLRSGPYSIQASSLIDSFTSDVGWGCMIRTGQSLLANALLRLNKASEIDILRKFCDDPQAPYSLHRFVDYGAAKCGKLPGEWFGPSAVAGCIAHFAEQPLKVYISSGADIFIQDLRRLEFPVLVLCGLRLGIQEVNPIYYPGLQSLLTSKQSVGIAGGRTSASHYFYGFQGQRLFYHDPHEPKTSLRVDSPDAEFLESVHSKRLRALEFKDMDPSMLAGFLLEGEDDFQEWKAHFDEVPTSNSVINITDMKPDSGVIDALSDEESDTDELPAGIEHPESHSERPHSREPTPLQGEFRTRPSMNDAKDLRTHRPISQEAIVTVDVSEPKDESTVEITQPDSTS